MIKESKLLKTLAKQEDGWNIDFLSNNDHDHDKEIGEAYFSRGDTIFLIGEYRRGTKPANSRRRRKGSVKISSVSCLMSKSGKEPKLFSVHGKGIVEVVDGVASVLVDIDIDGHMHIAEFQFFHGNNKFRFDFYMLPVEKSKYGKFSHNDSGGGRGN
jgi:hypothetical protein